MLRRISLPILAVLTVLPGHAANITAPPNETTPPPQVTTVLRADTPAVVLVNTNPEAWAQLRRFNPYPNLPPGVGGLPFLPPWLDFTTDIQPWLGDRLALVLLPIPPDAKASSFENHSLLLVPVKDASRLDAFITKVKTNRGNPQIERTYQGAKILEWEGTKPKPAPKKCPVSSPGNPSQLPGKSDPSNPCIPEVPGGVTSFNQSLDKSQRKFSTLIAQSSLPKPATSPSPSLTPLPQPTVFSTPPLPSPQPTSSPLPQPSPTLSPGQASPTPSPTPTANPIPKDSLAIAVLPGYLAVSSTAQPLEQFMDTQAQLGSPSTTEENLSLAQNPRFQRTMQHPKFGQALFVAYGDLKGLMQFALAFSKLPSSPVPLPLPPIANPDLEKLTQTYNSVDGLTWIEPEGLRSQSNLYYTTPQPSLATVAFPDDNQILERLPAATYLSANSRNFKQQWQSFASEIDADPTTRFITKGIRDFIRNGTGLDLDKDLIPWMDKQYVFFLFPTRQGLFPFFDAKFQLGLGLMIQTHDRPAAEVALKKFNQFAQKQPGSQIEIVDRTVQGQPVVSWEGRDGNRKVSFFSYGWVNNDTLILTTGTGPMADLTPKPYLTLNQNHTFKTATQSLPHPNEGYFYVNMGSSLAFLYGLFSAPGAAESPNYREFKRLLGVLRSISTTNSATAEKQQFDVLWVLGAPREAQVVPSPPKNSNPANQPSPTPLP
ncbi:MAG: DUF3352 domain-containing protein [Scytolyngbya sp. HA4215-MV1]|nr:DUF3352 domain-containing protein [Scytolyngbya sp. HA4215-MV1]